MAAILFICLVNNKNNAFLYFYKMLNLGQSGFNYLKGDQIKNKTVAIRTTVVPIRILIRTTVVPIRILIRTTAIISALS